MDCLARDRHPATSAAGCDTVGHRTPISRTRAQKLSAQPLTHVDATHDRVTLTHTASGGGYGSGSADLPVTVTEPHAHAVCRPASRSPGCGRRPDGSELNRFPHLMRHPTDAMGRADPARRKRESRRPNFRPLRPAGRTAPSSPSSSCCLLRAAAGLLLVVAGLLALPTGGQAQTGTTVYVNNAAEAESGADGRFQAQSFTTGPKTFGYEVTQVRLALKRVDGRSTVVRIRENNASNEPGDLVATLTYEGSLTWGGGAAAWNEFNAPTGTGLEPNTTYWITVNEGIASARVQFARTDGHGEQSFPASGWTIGNGRLWRVDEADDWSSSASPLLISVRGPPPAPVTIEPNFPSIAAGREPLVFTLTRPGVSTPHELFPLEATVDIVQDQAWLDTLDLAHTVNFERGSETATLTLDASSFSSDPGTDGDLTATVSGYGIQGSSATVRVTQKGLVLSKSSLGPAEGGSESYTVALATQPSAEVTVTITGHSGTDLTLDKTSLEFTTTDWNTAQTVQVSAGQDDDAVDDEVTLAHSASGGDYASVSKDLDVTVDDDDTTTVPAAPTSLTATASGTDTIDLSWTAPSDNGGSAITGYTIEVSPDGTSDWTELVANTADTGTTHSHTGLTAGTTRHYRVSAINANGTGTASNIANATTATVPGAPTSLTATASGTGTIDLSWTAPSSDGGSSITGYKIEVSPDGTSDWTDLVANTGGTGTTHSHTGLSAGTTRHYRVSAINASGTGTASGTANATTATTAPGAPTDLTATADGSTEIDLAWTAPSDNGGAAITGYKIEVSPDGTSDWTTLVANTGGTGTTHSHTGLTAGTTRHYRVSAINASGTGAASGTASATTATTAPGAPTDLTATADGSTEIDLAWTAPSDNGGGAITGYKIEVSPDGTSDWTTLVANNTGTTYSHTGLSAGTTRHYRVSAINANGTGNASGTANATTATTVPGAPTSLTATASGTGTINLSWTAPSSDGGSSITGYRIEVSSDGGSSWTDRVANTNSTGTTHSHTGLSAGTTRHYRVSAINANGAGNASGTASATTGTTVPGAPTSLTATASGTGTINLSWTAPSSDGGSSITGYRIEVSPNGNSSWTDRVANTNSTGTTHSHTGLSAGTTRHYRVSAINANGAGNASGTASATTGTTVPGAPTSLTATASGTGTIDLSWTAPSSDGGSSITGYRIEVSPNGNSSWTDRVANTNSTGTTHSHTGLSAGATRHYRVSAINTNGTGNASGTANATTATTVPGAPTGLSATASGSTTINLDWTAPTNTGGSDITGYRIEVSPNGNSDWTDLVANTSGTGTTYSHTSLSPGTTRHYRVSARNVNGAGEPSNIDDATTGTTVPGKPTGLTATADGTTEIDLAWTAPTNTGGSTILGYRIEVSPNGNSGWTDLVVNTGSTATTYSHRSLSPGTTRHYRVSAINGNGTGEPSNIDDATTTGTNTILSNAGLVLAPAALGFSEGASADYTVALAAQPTALVTVTITGYSGTDLTLDKASLEFTTTNWATAQTVTVTAGQDDDAANDEATLTHAASGGGYSTATASVSEDLLVTVFDDDAAGKAVLTMHALAVSVTVEGLARFEIRRSGGDMGWLKISYRVDESDGNYGKAWGYFKPGDTKKDAYYYVGQSTGTVTARVTGPSDPLCTPDDHPNAACTDDYDIGDPSSASMQVTASSASSADALAAALEEALAVAEGLTPDEAAGALFGEVRLSEARLAALDLLGNGNGRYDLGDLVAWIDRCERGEARCGTTSADSPPPSAAGLAAAAVAAGRPRISRRTRRRGSGRPGRTPLRTARRRRGRFAGYALAALLAAATTLSCADGPVGPAAHVPDPGFLTAEWSGPAAGRGSGVLLELEGPGIETVRAPGFELYESTAPKRHRIVVAGSLRAGPLVRFRVPDRNQSALYRVRVIEVTGDDYQLRDPAEYRAVIITN